MEQSPLKHQPRPEVFQQKIVRLYELLFKDPENEQDDGAGIVQTEGFWAEFFLLRPDRASLRTMLDDLGPGDLVELEAEARQLFARATAALKSGRGAADVHALETLSTFLEAVLAKKYPNPSSDIIAVLAGLDQIDTVFTDFVAALDSIIRNGRSLDVKEKAIEVVLVVTSGAYQTSLLTYFIQRDLFPAVMKFIQEADTLGRITKPFVLLGLLANYNKFESQNLYQMRLNDFVNEAAIQRIIRSVGHTCRKLRAHYVAVQDDLPEGWTLAGTMKLMGLGAIAPGARQPQKPAYDEETAKHMFMKLPDEEAAVLLATYDFTHANKLFSYSLVTLMPEKGGSDSSTEPPLSSLVSVTSYLLQHAHLSPRTTLYSHLNLMVLRLLIEDPVLCKHLCSDESSMAVRLCRQRAPHLPLPVGTSGGRGGKGTATSRPDQQRPAAAAVLDCMIDGINHNLRRRLDVGLYTLLVGVLLRVVGYMARSRTRLPAYHWPELFRSLLGLVKFMTTYSADLLQVRSGMTGSPSAAAAAQPLPLSGGGGGAGGGGDGGPTTPSPLTNTASAMGIAATAAPAAPAAPAATTRTTAAATGGLTDSDSRLGNLLDHVVNLLALALSAGEAFLPTPAAYDDLFYKVVEAGDVLVRFGDTYGLARRPSNSIGTLVQVATHYKEMLLAPAGGGSDGGGGGGHGNNTDNSTHDDSNNAGKKGKDGGDVRNGNANANANSNSHLTSMQVAEVIKQGYETLSIRTKEGLDGWERFREADERTLLKKMARQAVADVKGMVAG